MSATRLIICILIAGLGAPTLWAEAKITVVASTDASQVYVQAQLILTIEIRSEVNFQNGSLSKPDIPGVIIEALVEDEQREAVENGVRVIIFNRSYALFPSKVGPMTIPSIVFEAMVSDPQNSGLGNFFGRGRRVQARTDALTIDVKDIPSNFPKNQPFLPVKSLTIVESFEDQTPEIAVNKALSRRFEIRALGTLTSFLPSIKAPSLKNCEVYSENGTKSQEKSPEGLLASVNFSQVYLPSQPGRIDVPEQVIYWWNTLTDELQSTPIRAFELKVTGEAPVPAKVEAPVPAESGASTPPGKAIASPSYLWPILAGLFFVLWIATLMLLVLRSRSKEKIKEISEPNSRDILINNVIRACDKKDNLELLQAVRALYKSYPGCDKLYNYMQNLEDELYGSKNNPVKYFYDEIKVLMRTMQKDSKPAQDSLPALYPL